MLVLYFIGVGLRGFGGFATNNSKEVWVSLCGVLPELLQLIVFTITEIVVDVPAWCHMRWGRLKKKRMGVYDEGYSVGEEEEGEGISQQQ